MSYDSKIKQKMTQIKIDSQSKVQISHKQNFILFYCYIKINSQHKNEDNSFWNHNILFVLCSK